MSSWNVWAFCAENVSTKQNVTFFAVYHMKFIAMKYRST